MNVFVTDHPLTSDSSHRTTWKESVLMITLMLCPFVLALFWVSNLVGNQDTTDYTLDPFWEVLVAAVIDSLIVALVVVALYRLTCWLLRKKCDA
jgi:hypothetical protein